MLIMLDILFFIIGICVGSFLNVLIYRFEGEKRKSLSGRSFCPHCKEQIKGYDLVPVFSWLILRGKCRGCKKSISIQYPLVELVTGLVFVAMGYFFLFFDSGQAGMTELGVIDLLFWLFFASSLITIFVYDLKHQIIPDEVVYTALVVGLVYVVANTLLGGNLPYLTDHLLSGLLVGGFFYALAAISDGKWMGGGDIKLVAFMGLVLGWQGLIVSLYTAFVLGALIGAFTLLSGKKKLGSKIPFGPFLVIGTFAGLLYGEKIISFYVNMFL
jgi:prepilin signal peptidase PulO-like enzyme (type II secretory pathway)